MSSTTSSSTAIAEQRLRLWHPRFALCAVCRRPTRGFGWRDPLRPPRLGPSVWFCSMPCQRFFTDQARRSSGMVDLTEQEQAAIRTAVKRVAEIMEEIGWQTRLIDLTESQVLTLIEVAVGGFQDAMADIAAAQADRIPEVPF
ncbi:MAG: DUF6511 domain-containing protein [Beijerinckiaceae bacterium]|nr:DUF6511 domain-containing protein [Beijerinckiaceae bacterium]